MAIIHARPNSHCTAPVSTVCPATRPASSAIANHAKPLPPPKEQREPRGGSRRGLQSESCNLAVCTEQVVLSAVSLSC